MDRIILTRLESSDQGTFGTIRIDKEMFYTGELPWRDNQNNISCIPAGIYECQLTMSYKFRKRLYVLMGVNNREGVRIHAANLMGDKTIGLKCQLSGCIALGLERGLVGGQKAILLSTVAMRKFENLINGQNFILEIINGF